MADERFRQRLMYRMMQVMAIERPCRLGEMIGDIFSHSPEFFDPDAPSNAGPHFVHPYTEFTHEMREELQMSQEDYGHVINDVREIVHEDWSYPGAAED